MPVCSAFFEYSSTPLTVAPKAAFETNTSSRWWSRRISSSTAATSSSLPASAWTIRGAGAPASANALSIAVSSAEPHLWVSVTRAPRRPNATPVARPMPRVPPVTSTARPVKSFHIAVPDAARRRREGDLVHQRLVGDRLFEGLAPRQRQRALEHRDRRSGLPGDPRGDVEGDRFDLVARHDVVDARAGEVRASAKLAGVEQLVRDRRRQHVLAELRRAHAGREAQVHEGEAVAA